MSKERIERDIKAIKTIIKQYKAAVASAEKELTALDKPKPLKFGDKVKYLDDQTDRIILYDRDGRLSGFDENGLWAGIVPCENYEATGESIFDDLKALSEPLRNIKMGGNEQPFHSEIEVGLSVDPKDAVFINVEEEGCRAMIRFRLDDFEKFCKQGLRVVATAKQKGNEK